MVNVSDVQDGFTQTEKDWFEAGEGAPEAYRAEMMAPLAVCAVTGLRATIAAAPDRLNETVLALIAKVPGLLEASTSAYDGITPSGNSNAALQSVVDTDYFAFSVSQQVIGNAIKFGLDAILSDEKDWSTAAEALTTIGSLTGVAIGATVVAHMTGSEYRYLILFNLAVQIASYLCTRFGIDELWKRHMAGVIVDTLLIQGVSAWNELS